LPVVRHDGQPYNRGGDTGCGRRGLEPFRAPGDLHRRRDHRFGRYVLRPAAAAVEGVEI